MRILILGVGMQGKAALHDLVNCEDVDEIIAADKNIKGLADHVESRSYSNKVKCRQVDAGKQDSINQLISLRPDVIIDLLPSCFIDNVTSVAVKNGVHVVNTFFTNDKVMSYADEARSKGIAILPGCGLDPGIDCILISEAARLMDNIESINCYGAGIPEPAAANNPLKYKVTWTLEGVLRAYKRAGRIIRDGTEVMINDNKIFYPEHIHEVEIEGLGTLEAFPNGDALEYLPLLGDKRSDLKNMGRYTLRYPGHCAFWRKMVDLHLLDDEPVQVGDVAVDRKRYLAEALGPFLKLEDSERDIAMVRIEVTGIKNGQKIRGIYQVLDRRDLKTGFTAMSRTVGFTVSIGALLIGRGIIKEHGLLSPGKHIPYELFKEELGKRDIEVKSEFVNCS